MAPEVVVEDHATVITWRLTSSWLQPPRLKWTLCTAFTLIGLVTRLYGIQWPDSVAWDETHFGKFVNEYLQGTFFFDVHPPLAKMLLAFAGAVSGYEGKFEFGAPGDEYGNTNYVGMRVFCAILGTACISLGFLTVHNLVDSPLAASLAATLLICETSLLTISRFILLDPILLFFIATSLYSWTQWRGLQSRAFSDEWWLSMFFTGFSLGCVISCKFVGLFVILFVGAYTLTDLWELYGNLTISLYQWGKHFVARAVCLIAIPILLYLLFFRIHFSLVDTYGTGATFMSSAFQSTLEESELSRPMPNHMAYDSIITIKSHTYGGGLLHSHEHLYPAPLVEQQQITTYMHKDDNNKFRVKRRHPISETNDETNTSLPIEFVRHGDIVRLEHVLTKRNLHSHFFEAPVTKAHQQVTAYGIDGVGDIFDEWQILLDNGKEGDRIERMHHKFQLLFRPEGFNSHCYLFNSKESLPAWGFEQGEVTCKPDAFDEEGTFWNVEEHINPRLPVVQNSVIQTSFSSSLYELHIGMFEVNAGFAPKEGEATSQAWHWPINYKGQIFTRWGPGDRRVYLLGNPVIFALNLVCILLFLVLSFINAFREQRQIKDYDWEVEGKKETFTACWWMLGGWAVHYFPFFLMGRVLYFHHYMPAVFFNCMLTALLLRYLALCAHKALSPNAAFYSIVLVVAVILWSFMEFGGTSYGMTGPLREWAWHEWNSHWALDRHV